MKLCRAQGEIAQRIAPHNLAAHPAEYGLRPIPPYGLQQGQQFRQRTHRRLTCHSLTDIGDGVTLGFAFGQ